MRGLANENFPRPSIRLLREAGHDIVEVARDAPGTADPEVLARARREGRTLLTFVRDYGDLIFHRGHPAPPGVIYFRIEPIPSDEPARRLLALLSSPPIPSRRRSSWWRTTGNAGDPYPERRPGNEPA